jgi:hypothetical protein
MAKWAFPNLFYTTNYTGKQEKVIKFHEDKNLDKSPISDTFIKGGCH